MAHLSSCMVNAASVMVTECLFQIWMIVCPQTCLSVQLLYQSIYYAHQHFPPKCCAFLLLAFSQISVECLGFLLSWHPSTQKVYIQSITYGGDCPDLSGILCQNRRQRCIRRTASGTLASFQKVWQNFESQNYLFSSVQLKKRVPRNAVLIACFMKECLTASCSLICKKLTKTVDEHRHPVPESWYTHKNSQCQLYGKRNWQASTVIKNNVLLLAEICCIHPCLLSGLLA